MSDNAKIGVRDEQSEEVLEKYENKKVADDPVVEGPAYEPADGADERARLVAVDGYGSKKRTRSFDYNSGANVLLPVKKAAEDL